MKLTAIYRASRNGNVHCIIRDYPTKKAFLGDLRANGFRVLAICNEKQVEAVKSGMEHFTSEIANDYIKECL